MSDPFTIFKESTLMGKNLLKLSEWPDGPYIKHWEGEVTVKTYGVKISGCIAELLKTLLPHAGAHSSGVKFNFAWTAQWFTHGTHTKILPLIQTK